MKPCIREQFYGHLTSPQPKILEAFKASKKIQVSPKDIPDKPAPIPLNLWLIGPAQTRASLEMKEQFALQDKGQLWVYGLLPDQGAVNNRIIKIAVKGTTIYVKTDRLYWYECPQAKSANFYAKMMDLIFQNAATDVIPFDMVELRFFLQEGS